MPPVASGSSNDCSMFVSIQKTMAALSAVSSGPLKLESTSPSGKEMVCTVCCEDSRGVLGLGF